MPLVKNETGEPVNAECINKCGPLNRLDQDVSLLAEKGDENPKLTALVCPICHYLELYYGTV